MKILVLNGSPKPVSDTMVLTNAFLKGLNERGAHEVEIVNLIQKKIQPCRGCFGCWAKGDGKCVLNDDQNELLAKYIASDIVIWSFPLYCYSMPSHMKAFLDRTIPLVKLKMRETPDGRVQHESDIDFSRLHTVVISGCGFPDWEGNFDGLRILCRNSFGNLTDIYVPETPLLNEPKARVCAEPLIARFTEAGREYEKNLRLAEETVKELETPMLPKEIYLAEVNSGR